MYYIIGCGHEICSCDKAVRSGLEPQSADYQRNCYDGHWLLEKIEFFVRLERVSVIYLYIILPFCQF